MLRIPNCEQINSNNISPLQKQYFKNPKYRKISSQQYGQNLKKKIQFVLQFNTKILSTSDYRKHRFLLCWTHHHFISRIKTTDKI